MEHLASSPLLPQSASLTQHFKSEFRLCIPGCSDLDLQIQQLNPTKVLSFPPPPLPIPTHGTQLLRTQEVHSSKQWPALKWMTDVRGRQKTYTDFGDSHFSPEMVPSGHSPCGYNLPTCNCKIFRNAAEGPHILLILVSPHWEMTAACGPLS